MNHVEIRKLIAELYGLVGTWEFQSFNGGTTYYFQFKVNGKTYVASVHEQERRENSYLISGETKFVCATMKAKTFERDLRELSKWSFTQMKYILHPSN